MQPTGPALPSALITPIFRDSRADDVAQPFGWRRLTHLTRDEALARDAHRMAILRHLVAHPGESRQALTDALALPRSTATTLVNHLLAEGWLQKREAVAIGRGGRLAAPLHVQPDRLLLLGAEMNADEVRLVATSLTGEMLASEQARHEAGRDACAALAVVTRLLVRMQARMYSPDRRVLGVGLAMAAAMDAQERFPQAPPELGRQDAPLLRLLGERLRGTPLQRMPLHLQRDGQVAALGELAFSADATRTPLLYLNIGDGVDASVMVEDGPPDGSWQPAREIGHLHRSAGRAHCSCGQPGCADALPDPPLQFDQPALDNDDKCADLGALLVQLTLTYRPAHIVLGGSSAVLGTSLLEANMRALQQGLAATDTQAPTLSLARFGRDAAAMGAAALARHRLVRPLTEPCPPSP
jgi:predicted NBD/HSP70 family sugar kinase